MAHKDAGHYAAKHPPQAPINTGIAERVKSFAAEGRIRCADAHLIARDLQCSPAEVGRIIDLLEIRITHCQLGLFGHSPQKRIVKPTQHVLPDLQKALHDAQDEQKLSCFTLWKIAEKLNITRLEAACACETLQIKISPCQLGAF